MERTCILVKPDGLQRGLSGEILSRFERKGLYLVGAKLIRMDSDMARRHYEAHVEKDWFPRLEAFITSGPILALALQGHQAISVGRRLVGATYGSEADAGTIRGDLAVSRSMNLVHASDSPEAASRELANFFDAEEIHEWQPDTLPWTIDVDDEG